MSFSMKEISNVLLGAVLGIGLLCACGSAPSVIRERMIDVDAQMLRGARPEDDKPLEWCKDVTCYVFEDKDVRVIKKYITSLENKVRECQK